MRLPSRAGRGAVLLACVALLLLVSPPLHPGLQTTPLHPAPLSLSPALPSRAPWPGDPACSQFLIQHLEPGSWPPVALASYPGSGNTWLR